MKSFKEQSAGARVVRRMAQKVLDMPRLSSDNVPPGKSGRLPRQDA